MEKKKKATIHVLSLLVFLLFTRTCVMAQNSTIRPVNVKVGVVLNFDSMDGKRGRSTINMALSDFYADNSHFRTRLRLSFRDSKTDVVFAAAAAVDLIKNVQVEAILGPDSSMQANFIIELGEKAQVPIVTYSATSPSLTSIRSQYFIRATQNDSAQVTAVSALVQAFGWREAVLVYVDNEYGEGIIPDLTNALENVDTRVPYRSIIRPNISDDEIVKELLKLMTMQTRVFIVHMLPSLASRLFTHAKDVGMMNSGYVWIMTNGITNQLSSLNSTVIGSMQGVLGVRTYVPRTKELEYFRVRWKRKFQRDNPTVIDAELDMVGLWAHDAAVALALAVEEANSTRFSFQKTNDSGVVTDLESLGVSQNGPRLRQALSGVGFRGLTGDYRLVNGQLESTTFQIVNVNGNGWTGLGFWTPTSGLIKKLSSANTSSYSTSRDKLGAIIWPGGSTSAPKGWEIPASEKKLRIGVPKKIGFTEFVKVTHDLGTNATTVSGFCIEVFESVMEAMPYAVLYELIPFETPDGQSAGSYNDLVHQVHLQKFDAVVGDTTILANRSRYVDFTLPYTEAGVSIVVRVRDENKRRNAWIFLEPLTWKLWVTFSCSFLFIALMVWILEHPENDKFQGSFFEQINTSLWFSFSTMVFAHREEIKSFGARTLVIVWCFVVLILTSSYTAGLTSLLTVGQLRPTFTNLNELRRNGAAVGYNKDSFILDILLNQGFLESNIYRYETLEEVAELFSNGTIAAAFDEIPYVNFFLAQKCSGYTTIEPTFRTNGFGFVFPKGSPLVSDVSRAILSVSEGEKMKKIERTWLGPKNTCPDPSTPSSSTILGLESLWGLFLITGIAAGFGLALLILGRLLRPYREFLMFCCLATAAWLVEDLVAIGDLIQRGWKAIGGLIQTCCNGIRPASAVVVKPLSTASASSINNRRPASPTTTVGQATSASSISLS